MIIFLFDSETPLLEESLLSALSDGDGVGVEVVVITVGKVEPLTVSREVMVWTTGVWVVVLESEDVVLVFLSLSEVLVVLVGSLLVDEVLVVSDEVVSAGTEDDVVEVVSELVEVVCSEVLVEVGSDVVVCSEVVVGSDEAELDAPVSVRSWTKWEASALWAATAVRSRACASNDSLARRMMGWMQRPWMELKRMCGNERDGEE